MMQGHLLIAFHLRIDGDAQCVHLFAPWLCKGAWKGGALLLLDANASNMIQLGWFRNTRSMVVERHSQQFISLESWQWSTDVS